MSEVDNGMKFSVSIDTSDVDKGKQKIVDDFDEIGEAASKNSKKIDDLLKNAPRMTIDVTDVVRSVDTVDAALKESERVLKENVTAIVALEAEEKRLGNLYIDTFQKSQQEADGYAQQREVIRQNIALRKEIVQETMSIERTLESAKAKFDSNSQKIDENSQKSETLRQQIRNLKEEMASLIASGIDETSDAYKRLVSELGRLEDIQNDVQQQGRILANDQATFQGIISGVSGLSGAMSAATGTMALFGDESEDLQRVMTRLQSVMAITMGLQQLQQTLNKDSAFQLVTLNGLKQFWNRLLAVGRGEQIAETAATVADTTAKTANTAAQTAANVATTAGTTANIGLAGSFRMIGAAIKSIPVFGWIVVGITALIAVYEHFSSKAEEASKKLEEQQKLLEDSRQTYAKASMQVSDYIDKIDRFNGSKKQEKKMIEELNSKYGEALGYHDSLAKWKDVLKRKGEVYCETLLMEAQAQALLNKYTEAFVRLQEVKAKADNGEFDHWYNTAAGNEEAREKAKAEAQADVDKWEKDYKELMQRIQNVKDANDLNYHADPKATKSAEKAAKDAIEARRRLFETEQQQLEAQEQQRIQKLAAQNKSRIAAIANDAQRERAEQDEQHRLNLQAIDQREREMQKKLYEYNQKVYEQKNKGKSYYDTPEGKAGYKAVTLSDDQASQLNAEREAENAAYNRILENRKNQDKQYLLDYIKEYGSIQDRRAAITAEYDKKIAEESNAIQKAALEKKKQQALDSLDMEKFKNSINWEAIFNDLESQSSQSLESLKAKLREALTTGDVSAENAKVLAEKIREIEDLLSKRQDPFAAWLPGLRERIRLTNQVKEAEDRVKAAMANSESATQKVLEQKTKIKEALEEIGFFDEEGMKITFDLSDINAKMEDSIFEMFHIDENSELGLRLSEMFATLTATTIDLNEAEENLSQTQKDYKARQNALDTFTKGGDIGQYFKDVTKDFDFGEWAGYINMNAQSMADFADKIGLAGTDFGDAVHGFADGVGGFNSAIQSLASGDIFGAVGGIIDGVAGFGRMIDSIGGGFLFGNDDAYQTALDKWGWVLDTWEENVKYERELMEHAYGAKAIEESSKAIEAAQKALEAARNIYEGWAGSGAGWFSHSNGYNVNEGVNWGLLYNYDKDLFDKLGFSKNSFNFFGQNFETFDGDVSKLFDLTWQELEELKNRAPQFWASIHSVAQEYLDQYIEAGKAAEETLKSLREQLTTTTEENVFDDFLNSLYDLADGADDVMENIAENWQRMVNRMIINNFIASDFQDKLKSWYEELAQLQMDRKNGLIDEDTYKRRLESLRNLYNDYLSDAENTINEFTQMGIIKPIEEAAEEVNETIGKMAVSLKSAFGDLVNDPTQDIKRWGENLRNELIRQFVETYVLGEDFQKRLEEWSERYWALIQGGYSSSGRGMSKEVYEERLAALNAELDQMAGEAADLAKTLMDSLGYQFGNADTKEDNPFSSLRDMLLDTLTDMEDNAEAFKKRLEEIMVKDLIEKQIFDVPITVNGMSFDNFNAYVEDWNQRYADAVKSGNQEAIDALIQELVEVRNMTAEAAEELRERLKEATEDTTFKNLSDSWVSTLMDMSKTAEDWAQDIGRVMAEKIIREMIVADYMKPLLNDLQNAFDQALAAKGSTPDTIISAVTPFLNNITAAFPQLQELAKGIMDALGLDTTIAGGFSDLRSMFLNTLTDMQVDASAFGKNIALTMIQQMLDEFVKTKYQSQLDEISRRWGEALKAGDTDAMEKLRQEIVELYNTMENDEAIKKFMDDILSLTSEIQTPFDNMRDSFRSALMDMTKSAQDFTKEISQLIAQDFIDEFVMGSAFDEKLTEWKRRYQEITKDGNLTEEQRLTQLRQLAGLISSERDSLTEQTRNILNLLGLGQQNEDQRATMNNMAEAATYDQFELYLGIAMGQQLALEQGNDVRREILQQLKNMNGGSLDTSDGSINYVSEIRNMMTTTNEYLLAIKIASEAIRRDFEPILSGIRDNTSRLQML